MSLQVNIEIKGLKSTTAKMNLVSAVIIKAMAQSMYLSALRVQSSIRRKIMSCMSRGNQRPMRGGVTSYASLPGFPPNTDTGQLARSWQADIWMKDVDKVSARAFVVDKPHGDSGQSVADIALSLEEGTTKVEPRPVIRPTMDEEQPRMIADAEERARKAVEGLSNG